MRRITILFLTVVLLLFLRHRLARPPEPGALVIPVSLRKSFFEMERMTEAEKFERYTLRDWEEPR